MPGKMQIRLILCGLAAAAMLVLAVADADAARRGGGFGSRGSRTYAPPPVTQTAPNTAAPINRSVTQPQAPNAAATAGQAGAARGGFFNRPGLMGGLMGGLLGAGLFGLLFGNGLLGGLSGFAGFLGLLIQVVLVVIVARLLWSWWQRRKAPGYATAAGPSLRNAGPQDGGGSDRQQMAQQPSYGGGSGAPVMGGGDTIEIGEADFNAFEQRLSEVQAAYTAEDIGKLRQLATPEVVSYFSEELADNASRGVVNSVRDVKLLQGDLAEAWREGDKEYATVAMRYSSVDYTAERKTGNVVEGDKEPFERTELWTFLRSRGGEWLLSAVQEA
jgi:predicted lipid-binding transport protein (Tim44 family)